MKWRLDNQVESILGYDHRTRRLIGEGSSDDVLDAYRDLIVTAKKASTFEDLVDSIAGFLDTFSDTDDEGAAVEALFTKMLRDQVLSDEVQNEVARVVHESLEALVDGRTLVEDLEAMQDLHGRAVKNVNMARHFPEASTKFQEFLATLAGMHPELGAKAEEAMILAMIAAMKSKEFVSELKKYAKALAAEEE